MDGPTITTHVVRQTPIRVRTDFRQEPYRSILHRYCVEEKVVYLRCHDCAFDRCQIVQISDATSQILVKYTKRVDPATKWEVWGSKGCGELVPCQIWIEMRSVREVRVLD